MDIWDMVFDQRRQLADVLDTLDESQWNTPSLCEGWAVRDVIGHLVAFNESGILNIMLRLLVNGFNFDKMNAKFSREFGQRPSSELKQLMRKHAESRWLPPGLGPDALLTDVVLHTEDVCRPLGITRTLNPDRARLVFDFLMGPKGKAVTKPEWLEGLQLAPQDIDWSWGSGAPVSGTALDVIVAIAGRRGALDRLTGDGVPQLRSKIPAAA